MGFLTVPDKATGDVVTEADWDTYIRDNLNGGIPVLLADSTLSVAAASIDFTSIAQDWAHLMIVAYLRGDTAATSTDVILRFNADTAANYDVQYITGTATAAAAAESFAQTSAKVGLSSGSTAGANLYSAVTIEIPHYAQATNNKSLTSSWAWKSGTSTGTVQVGSVAGFWRSSVAITQVTLIPAAGNFVAGSRATLYGMPG